MPPLPGDGPNGMWRFGAVYEHPVDDPPSESDVIEEKLDTVVDLPSYFYINARGTIIQTTVAHANKIPRFHGVVSSADEPYFVDYSSDAVHKMLDSIASESLEEHLGILVGVDVDIPTSNES